MEQVCRALALVCRRCLRRRRGTSETQCLVDLLQYHQQRNAASRRSKKKRPRKRKRFAARRVKIVSDKGVPEDQAIHGGPDRPYDVCGQRFDEFHARRPP